VEISPDDAIKLASLQVISGELTSLGTDQVRGIELAIADKGDIKGHSVTLQSEDDLCGAEGGQTGAERIVADEQIVGIVGTSCSGAAVPASEIMSKAGLVMVSGSNTSPALTTFDGISPGDTHQDGYFRTAHNDTIQGAAAAAFAYNELGIRKAATIHDGDPYTEGLAGVFNTSFEELGGEIVLATAVGKEDQDMKPVLTDVAAAGAELLFFPIFQPAGDFIVLQSKEIDGFDGITLMAADGLLSDTFVESIGADGTGMYFSGPATPEGSAYTDMVAAYTAAYGEAPIQAFHAHAYDAAMLILDAIDEVAQEGSDGTILIGRQALRDALAATSGHAGITGSLSCDEFGDCAAPRISVVRLDDPAAGITGLRENVVFISGE
jgi:branched-chain amino acid transport system substrate-binding protein